MNKFTLLALVAATTLAMPAMAKETAVEAKADAAVKTDTAAKTTKHAKKHAKKHADKAAETTEAKSGVKVHNGPHVPEKAR